MPHRLARRSSLPRPRRGSRALLVSAAAAVAVLALGGCGNAGPVSGSREALGTAVSITAYGRPDDEAARAGVDAAFAVIADAEAELDAYDASSTVSAFNATPFYLQPLPPRAAEVFSAAEDLGVADEFRPTLFGVMRLYDFGGAQRVPSDAELESAVRSAASFGMRPDGRAAFAVHIDAGADPHDIPASLDGRPGLDFGGALKGLALDEAAAALEGAEGGEFGGALLTAGSTTLTFGEKDGGEPWRIGIEDPREPGRVIAVVESTGGVTVSTSGDYQQYFEMHGVRYHHILDPATGRPARGLRSLTVAGAPTALDSDILSTALFVMGPDRAAEYARRHGLGLYLVDEAGRARVVEPPASANFRIVEQSPQES